MFAIPVILEVLFKCDILGAGCNLAGDLNSNIHKNINLNKMMKSSII